MKTRGGMCCSAARWRASGREEPGCCVQPGAAKECWYMDESSLWPGPRHDTFSQPVFAHPFAYPVSLPPSQISVRDPLTNTDVSPSPESSPRPTTSKPTARPPQPPSSRSSSPSSTRWSSCSSPSRSRTSRRRLRLLVKVRPPKLRLWKRPMGWARKDRASLPSSSRGLLAAPSMHEDETLGQV